MDTVVGLLAMFAGSAALIVAIVTGVIALWERLL